ncbi:MAG TPA: radical SAM protein [Candidatus Deferrimicrobium sp.]|nr:radical SAM protein [Candidatus Deferrimicrobium sp.]
MTPYEYQYEQLQRIFIVVTDACRARCKLCSYWQTTSGSEKYLSLSFINSKVIPLIRQYRINGVCITGGEPALHPELPKILETLNQTGVIITLITNGSQLAPLFDRIKYNVHAWLFSLDADNENLHRQIRGLDNFVELIAWPEKIKAAYPAAQIAFNCLIQKQNIRSLVHLYELICYLPCEGLFFNVPDLNSHCFGRRNRNISEKDIKKYVVPDDEEMEILRSSLAEICELDARKGRGKIMQSDAFFKGCINYFEFLRGKEAASKDNDNSCPVPKSSLVVDESGNILSCFYLPPDFRDRPVDQQEELKVKYCRRCFQFQG